MLFNSMLKDGLSLEMMFQQASEQSEGMVCEYLGEDYSCRRNNKCRGSEEETNLTSIKRQQDDT